MCNSKLSLSLLSFTFYLYLNNNNKMATTPKDFTHLSAASIQTIAEAFGFVISDDVAKAFAPDVEYRLRDIIQEALKCTKRSRRNVLTTEVCFFMFLSLSFSRARFCRESNIFCVQLSMTMMVITLPSFVQKEILTHIPFSLSNSNLFLLSFV